MSRIALYTLFPVLALAAALPACGRDAPPSNTSGSLADAFKAAGFQLAANERWVRCQEDPPTLPYVPGISLRRTQQPTTKMRVSRCHDIAEK